MKLETLTQVNAERAARRPVIVVTDTANGDQRLVKAKDIATDPLSAELSKQLRMGKSGMVESGGKKLFLNVYAPTARLVIIGAVHISQALAPLARSLDYDVTVVDPRTAFASPERFPDVPLIAEWPDVALPPLNIDHYTAFVAVTHGATGVSAMIKHQQARFDARGERGEFARRGVVFPPVVLPFARHASVGPQRIGFVDQNVAAFAMFGETGCRRRIAGNDDDPVGRLEAKAEGVCKRAMLHRKSRDPNVAVGIDHTGRNLVHVHAAACARQAVDAVGAVVDIDLPRCEHVFCHVHRRRRCL